ncbi:hypothetical protein AAY473_007252 [Plecturocebus cupreus]
MILAHCNLHLLDSIETGFCHVGQAGFQLLTSDDLLTLAFQKYSGAILVHCKLRLQGSSDSPITASQAAGITGAHHHTKLIFIFLVKTGFRHVSQTGHELLTSGDLPASTSQSAGIPGVKGQTAWFSKRLMAPIPEMNSSPKEQQPLCQEKSSDAQLDEGFQKPSLRITAVEKLPHGGKRGSNEIGVYGDWALALRGAVTSWSPLCSPQLASLVHYEVE